MHRNRGQRMSKQIAAKVGQLTIERKPFGAKLGAKHSP